MRTPFATALTAVFLVGVALLATTGGGTAITAEGLVGTEQPEWQIYDGGFDGLQDIAAARANVWATELFGRDLDRVLFA